ncbi:MAG: FeoB-associated Cys-rich membrane protein [Terrimicrobiaceae bacterium]
MSPLELAIVSLIIASSAAHLLRGLWKKRSPGSGKTCGGNCACQLSKKPLPSLK